MALVPKGPAHQFVLVKRATEWDKVLVLCLFKDSIQLAVTTTPAGDAFCWVLVNLVVGHYRANVDLGAAAPPVREAPLGVTVADVSWNKKLF